jgi:hypothetical protein
VKILLWTDDCDLAVPVRNKLKEDKHSAMIRDARFFGGLNDAEQTDAIAFISAHNEPLILANYRSEQYVTRHGAVRVLDIQTGAFGEPISMPDLSADAVKPAPTQKDFLQERFDAMNDDDLRTYAKGTLGPAAGVHDDMCREELEALIRGVPYLPAKPEDKTAPPAAQDGAPAAGAGAAADGAATSPPPATEQAPPAADTAKADAAKTKTKTKA